MITVPQDFPTERERIYERLFHKLETATNLNRKLVSFQANKEEPFYRWFKYKEGFSSSLVKYFLAEYSDRPGKLLDPFAGAGTTLFAGQELGWESYGIELLPVGVFAMQTRQAIDALDPKMFQESIKNLWDKVESIENPTIFINHIAITKDAFPKETEKLLNQYLTFCSSIENGEIQTILRFAGFSVLEEISFTRKDGQYLRWDYRSKRSFSGKPFDKGKILNFKEAITSKINKILADISPSQIQSLFALEKSKVVQMPVSIIEGSCLEKLPSLKDGSFDFILTSPPYCNRYDYTRTYALELVYLGSNNDEVRNLRQEMLSCTVENKEKVEQLKQFYQSTNRPEVFFSVMQAYDNSLAMAEVNAILDELAKLGKLNNNNIARMVKNYFLELCFVIYEMARVMKTGGHCVMVNDNVRYGGEEIPVDLILCEFAENFGFKIKKILVLPKGKGNSSQQMGNYGRIEVRKCVYVWQKR